MGRCKREVILNETFQIECFDTVDNRWIGGLWFTKDYVKCWVINEHSNLACMQSIL